MRVWSTLLGTFSFCVLWLIGWIAWSIFDARAKTDQVFAPFVGDTLPITTASLDVNKQLILLAVEDPAFFWHQGIDLKTPGAGPRTITVDLAEWLYVGTSSPGISWVEPFLIALLVVDPKVAKQDQLTAYLNLVSFGERDGRSLIGYPAAARAYFGRDVNALSREQFARLTAMIIDPVKYAMNSEENWQRTDRIMALVRNECQRTGHADVYLEAC